MDKTKIYDVGSDDDSDKEVAAIISDYRDSNVLVYDRDLICKIGELPSSSDLPNNFDKMVEIQRDYDVSEIIFPSVPKLDKFQVEEDYDEVVVSDFAVIENLRLIEDDSVEYQITKFLELVLITEDQLEAMKGVRDALEDVLKTEFPDCKAFPFGSSASGLGFRDSDLDIHVELGCNAIDDTFYVKAGMWGDRFRTRKVCEILRRAERFKSAVNVLNARTPIIKLRDRLTRINCDINVVSCMGVRNTHFLAFCAEQDERFMPLVSILKYFCREQGVTSSGKGDHLNSYTMVLMVIFFLQGKGILYSLEVLQKGVEEEEVDGWNVAFNKDFSQLPELKDNKSSVYKLLLQFFKFYIDFPFDHVICPLVGQKVKKYNMRQGIYLPNVLEKAPNFGRKGEKIELNKAIVVQDPFELTRNVAQAVSRPRLDHMLGEFSRAVRLLDDLKRGENTEAMFWMLLEPGMVSYKDILHNHFVPICEAPLRLFEGLAVKDKVGDMFEGQEEVGLLDENVGRDIAVSEEYGASSDDNNTVRREIELPNERLEDLNGDRICDFVAERPEDTADDCVPAGQAPERPEQPMPVFHSNNNNRSSSMIQVQQFLFYQQSLRFPPPRL